MRTATRPESRYLQYSQALDALFDQSHYVALSELEEVRGSYSDVVLAKREIYRELVRLILRFKLSQARQVYLCTKNIADKLAGRERYNHEFVAREQRREYVSDNQVLDANQIEAIVSCEDAQLVLAPAGSGKTISLLAKIEYLIRKLQVAPREILAISFTRKSVKEIKDRIGIAGVNIHTFHSLGNKILKSQLSKKVRVIERKESDKLIRETLKSLVDNNQEYARNYNDYLLFYYSTPVDLTKLKTQKEVVEFNKMFLRQSLQSITLNKRQYSIDRPTSQGEFVKSKEEQIIANWLFVNQVPYEYEKQYPYIGEKYTPDFTLNIAEEPVYLEHFALQRDGTSHFANYTAGVEWKRSLHKHNKTRLIESYSFEWSEGTLLANLEKKLKKEGARVVRLAEREIQEIMQQATAYSQDIKSFFEVLSTFLALHKNSNLTLSQIEAKIKKMESGYLRHRALLFMEIYKPIYLAYEQYLSEHQMIDFADMINRGTRIVERSEGDEYAFKYILIDEVQDLSHSRYKLVKALLKKNPKAKLFAVGDDWQSIFRFAGGDLSLVQDFEATFGKETKRGYIEMTHRFGNPQLDVSSEFIQKNPFQSQKGVRGHKSKETKVESRLYTGRKSNINVVQVSPEAITVDAILTRLYQEQGVKLASKTIQLIGRYNWDIDSLLGDKRKQILPHKSFARVWSEQERGEQASEIELEWMMDLTSPAIKLKFCTMHKAKGITRDIVIILNANAGAGGIPSIRSSDPMIELLLAHPDTYPFAEERRLFYVAITRAREITFVVADRTHPSPFLYEIFDDLYDDGQLCPRCQVGELVERSGQYGKFLACSNYKYGCDYRAR